jgi:lipoyl(octanoyl) transferase
LQPIDVCWLGRVPYRPAWALQEELRRRVQAGEPAETILLVEHDPVVTLGRSADRDHVLLSPEALAARGVDLVPTSRGGDVTYHGPGQLVAYPVLRLTRGVVAHVEAMARAVVETVRPLGVEARCRRDPLGVWVAAEIPRKLCAFGVHVSRRVAIHGLALNVTTPPDAFSVIVPCGLRAAAVTSIQAEAGRAPTVEALAPALGAALAAAFDRTPRSIDPHALPSLLSQTPSVESQREASDPERGPGDAGG